MIRKYTYIETRDFERWAVTKYTFMGIPIYVEKDKLR